MTNLPDPIYVHEGNKRIAYVRSDLVPMEHASNEPGNFGKGLPNVPDNVPEKENIGIQAAMAEAIEFAAQDAQALTLAGEAMVQRWRNALAEAQKQQAVAWRYRYNGQWYLSQSKSFALNGFDLAPLFAEPIPRWDGWRSIDTAPEDQHVILCTSGGHVGEAIMLIDEDTGKQKWAWALGPLHPNHMPFGWQPLPDALNAPVASDLRPGGFDGPTGAE